MSVTTQGAAVSTMTDQRREASAFIQDCLNGKLGRKHQAAAERTYREALRFRFMSDSVRIANMVRGLAAAESGW
jgi:hypothetical protein